MPFFIPLLWVAGGGLFVWGISETGDAAEQAAKLAKWAAIGGGVYVSYKALQAAGAVK